METVIQFLIKHWLICLIVFLLSIGSIALYFLQSKIQCSRCKKKKLISQVREMRNKATGKIENVCYDCKPRSSIGGRRNEGSQTYDITDINL